MEIKDCGQCVTHTFLGSHDCYYCEIDQLCHAVGSVVSPCTPEDANNACISESSLSHCTKTSVGACNGALEDSMLPRQIHIALAGEHGMRVAWKTRGKPVNASVYFSTNMNEDSGRIAPAERSIEYLKAQHGHGYHHSATLRQLAPGTKYQYRIVCDGVTSTIRTFSTPAKNLKDATFLVLADMGYGEYGEAVATRARMEALKSSADVVVHAGDLSYSDDSFDHADKCVLEFCYEAVYDDYMEWMENITDNKPYMVAVGNHESECHAPACLVAPYIADSLRNFTAYNARWAMPSAESGGVQSMWYSFDYASVHFVVINTETDFPGAPEENYGDSGPIIGLKAGHFASDGAYAKWLEADLAKASQNRKERPWIVAVGHRPWFHMDGKQADPAVQKAHAALFEKYSVDLYLAGHLHSYQRLLPINGNTATPVIITGGAGCDEFASDRLLTGTFDANGTNAHWDYRYYNSGTQVGTLKASPTSLIWNAIASSSGEIIDTVTLKKSNAGIYV